MNSTTTILADVRLFKDANASFGLVAYVYPCDESSLIVSYDLPSRLNKDTKEVELALDPADFVSSVRPDGTKSPRTKRPALVELGTIRPGSKDGKLFAPIVSLRLPKVNTSAFDALF